MAKKMSRLIHTVFHRRQYAYPEVVLDILAVPSYWCLKCGRRYYA